MSDPSFEPLLSSDETEALLHAMRNNSANTQGAREVDLGSPDSLLRTAQEHADAMVRDFAAETRGILRRLMGTGQTVREGNVDVMPFNVFAASIVPGSAVAILTGEDGVEALLVVGAELSSRVLRKKLGGIEKKSNEGQAEPPRQFLSAVDRRILRAFLQEELDAFKEVWVSPLGLTIQNVPAHANDLPRVSQFESLLRIPVIVKLGDDLTDEIVMFMTAKAARLPKKSEPPRKQDIFSDKDRKRIAAQLSNAEVEVVAVLGRAQSSVRDVLALDVGDVIRLDDAPGMPLRVTVEGQQKFIGSPVVQHGNLAIEVQQILEGRQ